MSIARMFLSKIYRSTLNLKRNYLHAVDKYFSGPKAFVLVYHRVNNLQSDPLLLSVSPEHFEEQLSFLKKNFQIISLTDLVDKLKNGALRGNEVVITFDDGYKDNLTHALPIAKKLNVPISIFISTGIFGSALPFSWDSLYSNSPDAYLSKEDVKILSQESLVTIGSHTVNHPRLRDLDSVAQKLEMSDSKNTLEDLTGQAINYFAYPFGDYTDINTSAVNNVKSAGYLAAFSNVQRVVKHSSSMMRIPRILVRNWSGEEMKKKLDYFIK